MIRSQTSPCVVTVVNEVLHSAYEQALQYERISLGSHHLYGSSRLGTKEYLPGQYYRLYDNTGPAPLQDTLTLSSRRPWYSMEYQDGIQAPYKEPWGNTDNSTYTVQHQVGQKQYELTNHLGNVQATVSDYPVMAVQEGDSVKYHNPALASAYDYYPFGMLMPGRYVSDTAAKCLTITQTKWVTTWVDSCYQVPLTIVELLGGASVAVHSGNILQADAPTGTDGIVFDIGVTPYAQQEVSFEFSDVYSGSATLMLSETINGNSVALGSTLVTSKGTAVLSVYPQTSVLQATLHHGPYQIALKTVCVKKPVMTQETMLVDVCDDSKDKYRFGYNGQEKVNEWAGVGNHNTAMFWEYDTRTGRRLNIDPVGKPWESSYAAFGNNPISFSDINGDDKDAAIKFAMEASEAAVKVLKPEDIKSYYDVHNILYDKYKLQFLDPNKVKTRVNISNTSGAFCGQFTFNASSNQIEYCSGNVDVALKSRKTFDVGKFNTLLLPLVHEYIHRYQTAKMGLVGEENRGEREFLATEFNLFPNDNFIRKNELPDWDVEFTDDATNSQKKKWIDWTFSWR